MTSTVGETFPLGPGTLKIGQVGGLVDFSCLVNSGVITPAKDQADSTTKLCGTVKPGAVTYTYTLDINVDLDLADEAGLWALSQTAAGTQQDFEYVPSTAAGTKATGVLVIDPLPFGGDTMGDTMTADASLAVVGAPTYEIGGAPLAANAFAAPAWGGAAVTVGAPAPAEEGAA